MRTPDYDIFMGFKPELDRQGCLRYFNEAAVANRNHSTQGRSKGHWWTVIGHWSGKLHAYPGFFTDMEEIQGWMYTEIPAPAGKRKLKIEG